MYSRRYPYYKIFKVLTEGPTLRSLVSFAIMEGTVVSRFGTNMVVCFCLRTLHPGLTVDGFEDVLDRELQRGEVIGYSVGSKLTLLRVHEWLLLESALSVTLKVNGGASVLQLRFYSVVAAVKR